ncbi:hypothetical protein VTK73DRAFT_7800 [Phialemonium thermophilum]|uniref:Glycosyl hydrolases family 28 n=1 Tax=Phialemonium thermophilum TaxID=223376 RepID=A0ABR3WCR8_9PEZI
MGTSIKQLCFLALAGVGALVQAQATTAASSNLITYPIPSGAPVASSYRLRVRPPKGCWRAVETYLANVEQVNTMTGSGTKYSASMAYFDFSGSVEVSVQPLDAASPASSIQIRPLSYGIVPTAAGNGSYTFTLTKPANLVFQVDDDVLHALHILANAIETDVPSPDDPGVVYFGPGLHTLPSGVLNATSGQTIYIAGGAVLTSSISVWNASNVTVRGHGVLYNTAAAAVDIEYSSGVTVDGVVSLNSRAGCFLVAQSAGVTLRNLRAFSADSWGDGIDIYSSRDVLIEGAFLRTSDDCVAVYNHRNDWYGNSTNVTVRDSALWADVAHPVNVGTHGNPANPETLSGLTLRNLDILDHREPQMDYQGCIAINAGDANTVRDVLVDNVRVEDFRLGQLVNLRVMYNAKYNTAPGNLISNVTIRNLAYQGTHANPSLLVGYDDARRIEFVRFENLTLNGRHIYDGMPKPSWYLTSDFVPMFANEHVVNLTFT